MKRNWYAVYTRPQREKRVSSILSSKGIENFCPCYNSIISNTNKKTILLPLFSTYIFVYLAEFEIDSITKMTGVNLVYWKSSPAIIQIEEIEVIKAVCKTYINIKLDKTEVTKNTSLRLEELPVFEMKENTVPVKYQTVKISLPSLGYAITADRMIDKKEKELSSDFRRVSILPKKRNPLFTN